MLGLLVKDLYLLKKNRKIFIMFGGIACIFAFTNDGNSAIMAVAYFTMGIGMSVFTTISYDEFDHSNVFLMTLPITRKEYALEKAIFGIISIGVAFLVSMVIVTSILMLRNLPISWGEWLVSGFSVFIVMNIMLALLLPFQIKFGGENGRMVILGVGIVIAVIVVGVFSFLTQLNVDVEGIFADIVTMLSRFSGAVIIAGVLIILTCLLFLSVIITTKILNKIEY